LRYWFDMQTISIIIPVLNEEKFLEQNKDILKSYIAEKNEIVLIDGGSRDNSVHIANLIGCKTFVTKASRGYQLHLGALQSTNELLLFLHADTELPENALAIISEALIQNNKHWGCFEVCFSNSKFIYQIIAWFMNKRSCLTGIVTGDQAMFAKRESYFASGGFPNFSIMEDIQISRQLKKIAPPVCLSEKVITSGRKWESQGAFKTIIKMWSLRFLFFLGVSTNKLVKLY